MTINPLQTGTDNPLVSATWSLTLLQGAPILPDSAITARFGADGVVGIIPVITRGAPSQDVEIAVIKVA